MEPQIPVPTDVTTWPSALVTIVMMVLVLGLPSVLTYLGNKKTKAVARTLTENNGGSSVRDALDRIESAQAEQGAALVTLAARVTALEPPAGGAV